VPGSNVGLYDDHPELFHELSQFLRAKKAWLKKAVRKMGPAI